jgi:PRTRC genetic system protein E
LKVKEIEHLLDEYQVESVASKMDDGRIRVIYLPKVLDDKMNDADKSVLQNPFILKGTAEELDAESPAKIIEWVSKLKEGKDNLVQIQEELDKAAKAKKTPAKKAPAKKAAPPRKTAAQKKAEARAKQAEEMEGQGDLFEASNRLEGEKETKAEPSLEDEVAELGI